MALIPSPKQVREMVLQAMQERAPGMYASLSASGNLDAALDERVAMFEEQTSSAMDQAMDKQARGLTAANAEERIRDTDATLRQASEIALAQVLEFPPDESPAYPTE